MKETISNRIIWNSAAKTALVFAAVTVACNLLKRGIVALDLPAFVMTLLSGLVWAAEFFGCICLMAFFMKKLVRDYDGVLNTDTYKYGRRIALLSAILIASTEFLILYLSPEEKLQEMIDSMLSAYVSMLDSNTLSVMEDTLQNLPAITFVSNLIYCFLYGTVLSAILSRRIPMPDPFADVPSSDTENE